MKHGKRPTREQKIILRHFGFDPADWLISKNTTGELVIECRYTGRHRTIPKNLIPPPAPPLSMKGKQSRG